MDPFESTTSSEKNVCTDAYPTAWYAPTPVCFNSCLSHRNICSSFQLTYNTPFMTPFPSFNQYDMTGFATSTAQWPTPPTYNDLAILPPSHTNNSLIERPRSSPSTFGPSPNEIPWPENPLGIRFPMTETQMVPATTGTLAETYQTPAAEFATPSPPQRRSSADTQRHYPSIAPNPAGLVSKRRHKGLQIIPRARDWVYL